MSNQEFQTDRFQELVEKESQMIATNLNRILRIEKLESELSRVSEAYTLATCKTGTTYRLGNSHLVMSTPQACMAERVLIPSIGALSATLDNMRKVVFLSQPEHLPTGLTPEEYIGILERREPRVTLDLHAMFPYCWSDDRVLEWIAEGAAIEQTPRCEYCDSEMEVLQLLNEIDE